MPTLMQKIRLALRGWQRRRDEKNQEFLARNVSLPGGQAIPPVPVAASKGQAGLPGLQVDTEALVIAYLDASERTTYYLDTETGDVIESNVPHAGARYKAVPVASPEDDRIAFLGTLESSAALQAPESFRSVLSENRKLERAWFNFRNDRAIATIERWLRDHRLQ